MIGNFYSEEADAPVISEGGVVNALRSVAGEPSSPGSIVAIYGRNLSNGSQQAAVVPLPRTLAGATVEIGGIEAPLYYASPGQINAKVPVELAANASYSVVVVRGGRASSPEPLRLAQSDPGIAAYPEGGAVAQRADYSLITPDSPAKRGEWIILYLAGMGPTTPAVGAGVGSPFSPLAVVLEQPTVTIGGIPAEISFAGLTPSAVGLYQIVCRVPDAVAVGDVSIVVTQAGVAANQFTLPVTQ